MFTDEASTSEMTTEAVTTKEPFRIDTAERADWLLGKLATIRAEQERVKANAAKRIAELDADYNGLYGRFAEELQTFARAEADRRRRKTVTLMQGALTFRAVPARLVIEDNDTAMTTARAVCPAAVTVEEVTRFDRDAFLQHAKTTMEASGEILPGVKKTEAGESFAVKFGGSE